ncbi:MAG: substrate-binding domain-containing protein [Oceanipulchritudo sp.]
MRKILVNVALNYSFFREMWRGIVRYSYENNRWAIFPGSTGEHSDEQLKEYDGVIAMFTSEKEAERVRRCVKAIVNVSNRGLKVPSVVNDDLEIGRQGAEYLINKGYKHFAFIGDNSTLLSRQRREGFQKEVEKSGRDCMLLVEQSDAKIREWLRTSEVSTAVMCTDDYTSFRLMRNCWMMDIPVPQHLAILGVNNDETYCLSSSIGLSSVMLASEKIGFLAAKLLDDLLNGAAREETVIRVPPLNVISRVSTDMQSIQDSLVRKALWYIQENVHRSIRVNDLLDHLSVSRRTLERRFKEKLGHSPHFAINRARVEVAKKLLEATDMKMEDIAEHCGFSEARILYRNFRLVTGVSPARYRKNFR